MPPVMPPVFLSLLAALIVLNAATAPAQAAEPAPKSSEISGQIRIALPKAPPMPVYIFRPACRIKGTAVLFPGYRRNSKTYRDDAKPLARALCLALYVPHFAKTAFPVADYQHGGAGLLAAAPLLTAITADAEQKSGHKKLPLLLIGHSAGAQYLSRFAAYAPLRRFSARAAAPSPFYILFSAGTYAEADRRSAPPYGFKGLPAATLKTYLALPLTIVAGSADIGKTAPLNRSAAAMAQGKNRLARARNFWQRGKAQAAANKTAFNWKLHIIPRLGHSPRAGLASPAFIEILRQIMHSAKL